MQSVVTEQSFVYGNQECKLYMDVSYCINNFNIIGSKSVDAFLYEHGLHGALYSTVEH